MISLTVLLRLSPDSPHDVDVLAVLDFELPRFRPGTPALYQKFARQLRRPWTKRRTSVITLGTGTKASKIQDVDVLRSPHSH